MNNWTLREIALLGSNLSDIDVAEKTGRSAAAIRGKRQRLATKTGPDAKPTTFDEDKEQSKGEHWKREYDSLHLKYEKAVKAASVTETLVDMASDLAPKSYNARPSLVVKKKSAGSSQSAVLLLTDTHVGQVVDPDQTLGYGGYNFPTFLARLKFLEEGVSSIMRDHTTTKIDELVLCIGGDMIDGALNHGAEAKQKNTLFQQFYGAGHAIAQFIQNLAPQVPKIRIKTVVGNHCVDNLTEIFTRRGWLSGASVIDSDECLGISLDGKVAWQPIKSVVREARVDRMIRLKNRQFDFRGTEHHRFYFRPKGMSKMQEARWSEIADYPHEIEIPVAGNGAGSGSGVPDECLELVAAVLTDGSICVENSNVIVYQKLSNESWVQEAFEKSGLEFTRRLRERLAPPEICGRPWKGSPVTHEVSYRLTSESARTFLSLTGCKKGELPEWVWNLTRLQFERFLHTLLLGDGTGVNTESPVLYGKSKQWLGELQALCALHGWKSILGCYQPNNTNPNPQYRLSLGQTKWVTLGCAALREYESGTEETVWCVSTESENFFCRRGGISYFTGNTRWQNQHKMPTENRNSNLDHFLSAYVQALTKDIANVEWTLDKQPFAIFDVQGFVFHLSHGDHLRGGDKALGVPNHSVGRMISSTTQLLHKHGQVSPHYYLTGHLHRGIVLPHAKGSFIVNGGFPGLDCYGLMSGFSPVDPAQTFFFVHPKFGKTATYEISLKFAEVGGTPPYEIPGGFDLV